jgi:hypothetical protein
VTAQASQFPDHLARSRLLRLVADGRPAFLVANALVKDLPNQPTEPMSDGTNGLSVSKPRDEPAIDDSEDRALGFYRGVVINSAPNTKWA